MICPDCGGAAYPLTGLCTFCRTVREVGVAFGVAVYLLVVAAVFVLVAALAR